MDRSYLSRALAMALAIGLAALPASARAQDEPTDDSGTSEPAWWEDEAIQPAQEAERPTDRVANQWPVRSGFTTQFALGVGFQTNNPDFREKVEKIGLGGLNFGFGAFVNETIALLARASTTVTFPRSATYDAFSMGGVLAADAQFWPLDTLRLEVGIGLAYHYLELREGNNYAFQDRYGLGLLFAVAAPFWHRGPSVLTIGGDYTPLFIEDGPLHSVSFTMGWQFL